MAIRINAALLLVAVCVSISHLPANGNEYADNDARILILGAGAAGLQAAQRLVDAGLDNFIVIEAADRIGGRVDSTQFAGKTVEAGSTWALRLPEESRVVDIVNRMGLANRASNYDSVVIRSDAGADVSDAAFQLYDVMEPAVERMEALQAQMLADDDVPDMSQRSALRTGGWIPETANEKIVEWFEFDITYGDTPETTSLKQTFFIGEEYWITDAGGLKQIFEDVAPFLQNPKYANHTRFNKKVASVDYTNDISVVVTCEDGTRFVGEYVLVTFSLGVLQHGLVEFIPPLPEWKEVEIQKFQMTAYTKVFLSFPSRFWDDVEWILHASDRRGYYPGFFNYQAEGFFPGGTPTLVAIITGDEARRVEGQSADKTKAEAVAVLRGMYGDGIPDATGVLVTDWYRNPLTRGAFSNFPVEVPTECFQKLESRVGRVFFGGEATSYADFGTVDGALESGQREADKILDCLNDFSQCPAFEGDGLECEEDSDSSAATSRGNILLAGIAIALSLKNMFL